ncbi:MAG: cupin domain-containing protein [Pseudonocardiales bacterium]|nr:cupin domain-containing protein [Pseudonocardiales bacterium]
MDTDLRPELVPYAYVFATVDGVAVPPGLDPFAVVREDEGLTLVLRQRDADAAGLTYVYLAARITLRVHSDLADVGLTATVSTALAAAGISCNVIAGYAHDHLFVPWDRATDALEILRSTPPRTLATVVTAADGERIPAGGVEHLFKLTGAQTGGRLGVEEFVVPPLTLGARPHIHWAHDEYFYVLEGELTLATDGGEAVLGPGDLAHAPRGSVHGFRNASEAGPARALCLYTPPGYEDYFRDVHAAVEAGAELTAGLLTELRARYDTESL